MLSNVIELVTILVIFIIILVAAYYTSKWVGKNGGVVSSGAKNIQIIETQKISQTKYIQIVKIGDRYLAVGITKDNMTLLCDLSADELDLSVDSSGKASFKELYIRMLHKDKKDQEK